MVIPLWRECAKFIWITLVIVGNCLCISYYCHLYFSFRWSFFFSRHLSLIKLLNYSHNSIRGVVSFSAEKYFITFRWINYIVSIFKAFIDLYAKKHRFRPRNTVLQWKSNDSFLAWVRSESAWRCKILI